MCQDSALLLALGPRVLNLAPILWLRSRGLKTRVAAVVATALGSAPLLVPAGAWLLAGPTQEFGTWFEPNPHFPNENSNAVFAISAALWLAGVIALAGLALLRPRHADLPDIDSVAGQES